MVRELSDNEKEILITCLEFYHMKRGVRWNYFLENIKSSDTVSSIIKKFRRSGYIKKKDGQYFINEKKLPEIEKLLQNRANKEIEYHKRLKNVFPGFKLVAILILILIGATLFIFGLAKTPYLMAMIPDFTLHVANKNTLPFCPCDQDNITNFTELCRPSRGYCEQQNKTLDNITYPDYILKVNNFNSSLE